MTFSRRALLGSVAVAAGTVSGPLSHAWRVAGAAQPGTPAVASGGTGMFRGNPERTGLINAGAGPAGRPGIRWRFQSGKGEFISSPALDGSRVFVGSTDGNVYAVAQSDGQQAWRAETGSPVISSPAVAGGVVYVGSFGALLALDAASGAERWTFATGAAVDSSPVVVRDVVYVGGSDGNLYAIDAGSGELATRSPFPTGSPVLSSPAVHDGVVYVGGYGLVYALRADDLAEVGRYTVDGPVDTAVCVLGDRICVATSKGTIYLFDAISGDAQPGMTAQREARWSVQLGGQVFSSPAVATVDDRAFVLVGCGDSNLYALDARSGTEVWRVPQIPVYGPVSSSPVTVQSEAVVYVGAGDGTVVAVDLRTQEVLDGWPFSVGSRVDSSPTVLNDALYVGSADGLIAIEGTED
jgi:outer membrane protein assembly factor BamB